MPYKWWWSHIPGYLYPLFNSLALNLPLLERCSLFPPPEIIADFMFYPRQGGTFSNKCFCSEVSYSSFPVISKLTLMLSSRSFLHREATAALLFCFSEPSLEYLQDRMGLLEDYDFLV